MKLIFLDIDGVLATRKTRYLYFDEECTSLLLNLMDVSGAKLVISSTWRHLAKDTDELLHIMNTGAWRKGEKAPLGLPVNKVIGATPDLCRKNSDFIRGHEIQAWLDEHGEEFGVEEFVILDDDSDVKFLDRHVHTDTELGFQLKDSIKTLEILKV